MRAARDGQTAAAPAAQPAPQDTGSTPHGRRASRFQQMMEQYHRTQAGAPAPQPGTSAPAGHGADPATGQRHGASDALSGSTPEQDSPAWSAPSPGEAPAGAERPASGPGANAHSTGGVNAPSTRGSVDWSDDIPSDDDETIEDSGLAGRPVVERILGARLIEERSLDGGPLG